MKVIVAVDKFKGSLTSFEAGDIIKKAIKRAKPASTILHFPMADGGDGFINVLASYQNLKKVYVNSVDPLFRKMRGYYYWDAIQQVAFVELAVCSGIVLLKSKELDPLRTSTFGTGLLIKSAIAKGAKKVILGLGGSATNDGGIGIAAALGFQFMDALQNELPPIGSSLSKIRFIIAPPRLSKVKITIACDVTNPLYGKNGAAYIYSPQKGATTLAVKELDKGLKALAKQIKLDTGKDISKMAGFGAAGGVAAMLYPYYPTKLVRGIDLIIKYSKIEKELKHAHLLITGEGRIDNQSLSGKVVGTLVEMANSKKIPVLLVAGSLDFNPAWKKGNLTFISLVDSKITTKMAIAKAATILHTKVKNHFSI